MRLLTPALPFLRGRGGKGKNEEKAPPAPEPAEERICLPLRKVAFHMAKRVASEVGPGEGVTDASRTFRPARGPARAHFCGHKLAPIGVSKRWDA